MSKPISPSEVASLKAKTFPAFVFDAFNACIAAKSTGGSVTIKQKDVVAKMLELANDNAQYDSTQPNGFAELTRAQIYEKGYLNVEDAYREAGWKVTYDSPAYNESYDATFTFKAK